MVLSEAFQNIWLLQDSHGLKNNGYEEGEHIFEEDKSTELTTSLSIEVNNLQSIVQTL